MPRIFGAPRRYVQGPDALAELPEWIERLGGKAYLVTDATVRELFTDRLAAAFGANGVPPTGLMDGDITFATIDEMTAAARAASPSVVVGMGGGKALDMGKAVARELGAHVVTVPTIASNDAPTSKAIAVYDADHVLASVEHMPWNPDVVLVDTAIVAAAPARFLRAGIGDALAKKFEAEQARDAGALTMHGTRPLALAQVIADGCYDILRRDAMAALAAVDAGTPDEALERVVEAAILLSGLGFENGGLSVAHAMTRGLMAAPDTASALHGEHVAYALLVQLLLEPRPEAFIDDLIAFYDEAGLPRRLSALGMGARDPAQIETIVARTHAAPHTVNMPRSVDPAMIREAMAHLEDRP